MSDPLQQMIESLPGLILESALHFSFVILTSWPGLILLLLLFASWALTAYKRLMLQVERMDRPSRRRSRW